MTLGIGFNISAFSSHIRKSGTLQTNKYYVELIPPQIISNVINTLLTNQDIKELIYYRAEQVKMPGVSLDSHPNRPLGYGVNKEFPTNVTFTDNNITFIDNGNNTLSKFFYTWLNFIYDFSGALNGTTINTNPSFLVGYRDDYICDMKIHVFGNAGNPVSVIVLKEAFPKYINDVSLDWSQNNSLYKIVVGFAFSEWYIENLSL